MKQIPATVEPLIVALEAALAADNLELAVTTAKSMDDMLRTVALDEGTIRLLQERLRACRANGEGLREQARDALVARQRSHGQLRNYHQIARSGSPFS